MSDGVKRWIAGTEAVGETAAMASDRDDDTTSTSWAS
jgi:hypothetical protein